MLASIVGTGLLFLSAACAVILWGYLVAVFVFSLIIGFLLVLRGMIEDVGCGLGNVIGYSAQHIAVTVCQHASTHPEGEEQ